MDLKKDQISRIKIAGYKSIKNCDLEFGRCNVLIGSNGAGKSNFISAFTMLQNILSKNFQLFIATRGVNSLFYNGIKETDEITLEAFFGENSYGFNLIPTDDNRIIFKKEYFGYHGAWNNDSVVAYGNAESKWDEGVNNRIDEYVIPILERQKWRVYHFHDTGQRAKVKQEHNVSNNEVMNNDASNLAAFLYRLEQYYNKNYKEIVRAVQIVAPYFMDFVLRPSEGNKEKIVLRWRQKGSEDILNASQLSDGTLRFICLATLFLQPKELQPATIIVDEPELGLHPFAINIFADIVRKASQEKQIILSTQSVELLNEFDVEDIIVVDQ